MHLGSSAYREACLDVWQETEKSGCQFSYAWIKKIVIRLFSSIRILFHSDSDSEVVLELSETKRFYSYFCLNIYKTLSIFDLSNFKKLRVVFLKLNTALPSSASVERIFSIACRVLTDNRCAVSDKNFKMQLLLNQNTECYD